MTDDYCLNSADDGISKCASSSMVTCHMSEDDDQMSHDENHFDRTDDLMITNSIASDDFASHLASSGMAGIAAAAAITSARRKNKSYTFETIPAVRKRQSTRLLRKLQHLIEEYTVRVGQQAVILICNPKVAYKLNTTIDSPSSSTNFKVYGSSPLETVVRNMKPLIVQELDTALRTYQALHEQSSHTSGNQSLWNHRGDDLPPLMVDGIPTPLDKMTQAQLRAFIPVMLKYSTGRGKPGWGRPAARPPWWPDDVPWANVRSDVRSAEEKAQVSWTAALKKVVRMCYEFHGREDLLVDYSIHGSQGQPDVVGADQLLDIDGQHGAPSRHVILNSGSVTNVRDPNTGVYTLEMGMMHVPSNDVNSTAGHFAQLHPSYSFKTEKDGTFSIIRLDTSNTKIVEAGSLEAAATLEDYNSDSVTPNAGEEMGLQSFSTSGGMVSLPAGAVMQLDSNSTAAFLQIFTAANPTSKDSGSQHSPVDTDIRKLKSCK